MRQVKVSVIIPVYNVEDKIVRCLDSLRVQTLKEVEIVLVDGRGTDSSMEVARVYAASHPDMNFVFADSGSDRGPGVARNIGIRSSGGEFVAFVDSDDWVDADFCDRLYGAAVKADAGLAYCHISLDWPDGHSIVQRNPVVPDGRFDRKSFLLRYKTFFTTFIYRRAFLQDNGICFPETYSAEDTCFLLSALLTVERIAHVDAAMYHYVISESSLSRRKDRRRWKIRLKSMSAARNFARSHGVYKDNRLLIEWLCFKKGALMALKDVVSNF